MTKVLSRLSRVFKKSLVVASFMLSSIPLYSKPSEIPKSQVETELQRIGEQMMQDAQAEVRMHPPPAELTASLLAATNGHLPPAPTTPHPVFKTPLVSSDVTEATEANESIVDGKTVETKPKLVETLIDMGWVAPRMFFCGLAFYQYYVMTGVSHEQAFAMGMTGAILSGGFQATTNWYKKWVTRKGWFSYSKDAEGNFVKVGAIEALSKDYSLQWVYTLPYQAAAVYVGLDSHVVNWDVATFTVFSLIAEGTWGLTIAKWLEPIERRIQTKHPLLMRNITHFPYLALAVVSSLLMVAKLSGSPWANGLYYGMMGTGGLLYAKYYVDFPQLKENIGKGFRACKRIAASATQAVLRPRRR